MSCVLLLYELSGRRVALFVVDQDREHRPLVGERRRSEDPWSRPLPRGAVCVLGPADPAERISVTAYLRPGQPLDTAVDVLLSAPPGQRRHLSRDEFADSFG